MDQELTAEEALALTAISGADAYPVTMHFIYESIRKAAAEGYYELTLNEVSYSYMVRVDILDKVLLKLKALHFDTHVASGGGDKGLYLFVSWARKLKVRWETDDEEK